MKGRYIDVDGVKTYYLDEGEGPAIVLLHGASVAVDAYGTWFRTMPALRQNFRVIALDQIGFGRTDMPKDGRYVNRLHRCDHALAFLDRLGIAKAIFVGHSEGGFVGARLAILRPNLAAKLVIVTSGATSPRLGGDLDREWVAASKAAYDYGGGVDTEDGFIRTNSRLGKANDPEFEAIIRDNYRRATAAGQVEMFRHLPEAESDPIKYVALQETYIHPFLPQFTVPTLLIWAAEDGTVPVERGLKLMRLFPKADMHVFAGAAHMVMLDRTDDFNRLLMNWCSAAA